MSQDRRYVIGERCTWHGPISQAVRTPMADYACPYCGGSVSQFNHRGFFWTHVELLELMRPGYSDLVEWQGQQTRCFPDLVELQLAYAVACASGAVPIGWAPIEWIGPGDAVIRHVGDKFYLHMKYSSGSPIEFPAMSAAVRWNDRELAAGRARK